MAKEYEIIASEIEQFYQDGLATSSWLVSQPKYSPEMEKILARILLDRKRSWMLGNVLIIEQML